MNYTYLQELGKGAFGSVWKVMKDGKIIALKKIQLQDDKMRTIALKEVELLKKISNPCIPSLTCFYDYHIEGNTLFIEMEYIEGETLLNFSKKYRGNSSLYKYLLAITKDLVQGIQYLHKNGIIHRDIKPENIMIDKNNQPKLIDIGIGCKIGENNCKYKSEKIECCLGRAGTPLFMAPETLFNNVSYFASDIFSLGATLYFSATGANIYSPKPKTIQELTDILKFGKLQKLETDNIQLNRLVNDMLDKSVENRITSEEIEDYLN